MIPALEEEEDLARAYQRTLSTFLHSPSEEALTGAYQLGRRALKEGKGVIDWAGVHDRALAALPMTLLGPEGLARAGTFYRESLSPFEMTQRGYAETNRWLERLNAELRREISAKESLAAQLQEANASLESFSYSVAHDLRAPLRAISGFSDALIEDLGETVKPTSARFLQRISAGAIRMGHLIDALLGLARVSRVELARSSVSLSDLAGTVLEHLKASESARVIEAVVEPDLVAQGDPALLRALLENLIGNAWKFTSKTDQARIEIGRAPSDAEPAYFVRDNGPGFDMAYAAKLFEPFQRLHSSQEFPGTGIGLATVHRIVRRHGGRIWAEATVGGGATFYFTLPKGDEHGQSV
jgi:light-regulated signal transduction histidine kinase (bacteriophytochrome)